MEGINQFAPAVSTFDLTHLL
jgi:hypothetical protein